MIQKLSESVSVSLTFNHIKKQVLPKAIVWKGKLYGVTKVGLHHTYREGRVLYHVFSVSTQTLFFRLVLDTESLHWKLEEISDGLPD